MNEAIEASYNEAKKLYARHGIQVDDILRKLSQIKISLHCWQEMMFRDFCSKTNSLAGDCRNGQLPGQSRHAA